MISWLDALLASMHAGHRHLPLTDEHQAWTMHDPCQTPNCPANCSSSLGSERRTVKAVRKFYLAIMSMCKRFTCPLPVIVHVNHECFYLGQGLAP